MSKINIIPGAWSHVTLCPTTGERLRSSEIYYSGGICPRCGHDNRGTITHKWKLVYRSFRVTHGWKWWKNYHYYVTKNPEDAWAIEKLGHRTQPDFYDEPELEEIWKKLKQDN